MHVYFVLFRLVVHVSSLLSLIFHISRCITTSLNNSHEDVKSSGLTFNTGGGRRSNRSSESPLPPSAGATAAPKQQPKEKLKQMEAADVPKKMFNPFCSVDGMQLSIHCHINAVKTLVCAPRQVAKDSKHQYEIRM